MAETEERYKSVMNVAERIGEELRRLGRWDQDPLPDEKYNDMGAFGSNTMSYEQWIQFILIPNIRGITEEKADFPDESNLSVYGVRYFDTDPEAENLQDLLYELDNLINNRGGIQPAYPVPNTPYEPVIVGDSLPPVIFSLLEVLPQFEGDQLESQLQTFDTFLAMLAPSVRPELAGLIRQAGSKTENPISKARILAAADSLLNGGRAAPPYDHEAAMKKYREEFRKGYE